MREFWDKALLSPLDELSQQVFAVLPNVLAMILIVTIGLVVAWLVGLITERLLRVMRLDHLCDRLGVSAALVRGGVKTEPSHLVGRGAYWMLAIFFAIAGLGALNLQPINQFTRSLLAYVPHMITAGVIVLAGYLLSNFISRGVLITAVNAGLPPARLIAAISRWGVQLFAVAMALEQLGIAEHVVVVGFAIAFGGVVFAVGLAFGLGAKDLAKDFLDRTLTNRVRERKSDDLRHL